MSEAIYREEDIFADNVSKMLNEHGMLTEDDEASMKAYLRGW